MAIEAKGSRKNFVWKIADIMEKAERSNSARPDTIAEAQVRMSKSFYVLVRHLC